MTAPEAFKPLGVSDPFGFAKKTQGSKKAHPKSAFTVASWESTLRNSSSYLKIMNHGGGCCGAKHIASFPFYDIMWELELVKRLTDFRLKTPGQTIEAILINSQADAQNFAWTKCLLKLGFKMVSHNRNSNSSNENFVFLLTTAPLGESNKNLKQILKLQQEVIDNAAK